MDSHSQVRQELIFTFLLIIFIGSAAGFTVSILQPQEDAVIFGSYTIIVNITNSSFLNITGVNFTTSGVFSNSNNTIGLEQYSIIWPTLAESDGSYLLNVTAYNSSGSSANNLTLNITIDNTGPNITVNGPANQTNLSYTAMWTWINLTTNEWANCSINGTGFDTTAGTSHLHNLTVSAGNQYLLIENCTDIYENYQFINHEFGINSTPNPDYGPTITNMFPWMSIIANTYNLTFNFTCTANDDLNLTNVSMVSNASGIWTLISTDTNPSNGVPSNLPNTIATDGEYLWTCQATDNNSNTTTYTTNHTLTIETTIPTITTNSPANESVIPNSQNWTWINLTTNEWAVCKVNGTTFNTTSGTSHLHNLSVTPGNEYMLLEKCTDAYGNYKNQTHHFWVNSTPNPDYGPTITNMFPWMSIIANTYNLTFNFTCTANDDLNLTNVSMVSNASGIWTLISTDTNPSNGVPSNLPNTIATDGEYLWTCQATDNNSNTTTYTTNHTLNIDTTPPSLLSNLAVGSYNLTWIYWQWTQPETGATYEAHLNGTLSQINTSSTYINFTGLTPNTSYEISVWSFDSFGNKNTTPVYLTNTTEAAADSTPPFLNNTAHAAHITYAEITWDTDEPSNSLVKYGTQSGNYTMNMSSGGLVTSHIINLTSLTASTTYYYVVNSTDASGNSNESAEYNFTTLVNPCPVPNNSSTWVINGTNSYTCTGSLESLSDINITGNAVLILNGTNLTINDNWLIILEDNASMEWYNLDIASPTNYTNIYLWHNSSFYIYNTTIQTNPYYISSDSYDSSFFSISDSNGSFYVTGLGGFGDSPTLIINNSVLTVGSVGAYGSYTILNSSFSIFSLYSEYNSGISIDSWEEDKSTNLIAQSAYTPFEMYINDSTFSEIRTYCEENSSLNISNSVLSRVTSDGDISLPSTMFIDNVTATYFSVINYGIIDVRNSLFSNPVTIEKGVNITFTETVINNTLSVTQGSRTTANNLTIDQFFDIGEILNSGEAVVSGNITILNDNIGGVFNNQTNLTRNYPITVYNDSGLADNVNITIYLGGTYYFTGLTSNGYIEAGILFNETNYYFKYNISVDGQYAGQLNLTSDTPINLTYDTTPPSQVSNLNVSSMTDTTITWQWTEPETGAFYEVFINGTSENANTSSTFYQFTALTPNTTYTVSVWSYDLSGNKNTTPVNNTNATIAAVPDNNPTVALDFPPNGIVYSASNYTWVNFSCTAYDDYLLTNLSLYTNKTGSWQLYNYTTPENDIQTDFLFIPLPEGVTVWNCLAEDNASQTVWYATNNTIKKDTVLPTITIINPTNLSNLSFAATSTFLNITTSEWANCTVNGTSMPYVSGINHSSSIPVSNGSVYYLEYSCVDGNGNTATAGHVFYTDPVPPDHVPVVSDLGSPASGTQTTSGNVIFNCTAYDDYNLVNVSLHTNSSGWSILNSTDSPSNGSANLFSQALSDGYYLWNCQAWDNSSSSSFYASNSTLLIDSTPPTISLVSLADNYTQNATIVTLDVNASDANGIQNVSVYVGDIATTVPMTYQGPYWIANVTLIEQPVKNIEVIVYDQVGNYAWDNTTTYTIDDASPVITQTNINGTVMRSGTVLSYSVNVSDEDNITLSSVTAEGHSLLWSGTLWTGTGAVDNDGTVNVTVVDQAGNTATHTSTTYTIDNTAPTVQITVANTNKSNPLAANSTTFSANVTDVNNLSTVYYKVDTAAYSSFAGVSGSSYYNSSVLLTLSTIGKHTIYVKAVDIAANLRTSSQIFYNTLPINLTLWEDNLDSSVADITYAHMSYANGTEFNSSQDQYVNESFNLFLNTTAGIEINITDINGIEATWTDGNNQFNVEINNSGVNGTILGLGKEAVYSIYFPDFDNFTNKSNYDAIVVFPGNASAYVGFYYCTNTTFCEEITLACTVFNGTNCYDSQATRTVVYVDGFSGVVATNDSLAPTITIDQPLAITYNSSYQLPLSVSVNENATCGYLLNGYYTILGTDTSFTSTFNLYENNYFNLTINCTDLSDNSNQSSVFFTINDTTEPIVTVTSVGGDTIPSSGKYDTTDTTPSILITTSEPSGCKLGNYYDTYYNMTTNLVNTTATSKSYTYGTLALGTYYKFILCSDYVGNIMSAPTNITWRVYQTSNDDGGSSNDNDDDTSTSPPTQILPTARSTSIWTNIEAGEVLSMYISKTTIAVTQVDLKSITAHSSAQLTVEALSSKPSGMTTPSGDGIFQYLKFTPSVISSTNTEDVVIKFRVTKSWMNDNDIDRDKVTIWRWDAEWTALTTERTGSDTTYYYYRSDSPGLSYFAITADELPVAVPVTTGANETNQTNATAGLPTEETITIDATVGAGENITEAQKHWESLTFDQRMELIMSLGYTEAAAEIISENEWEDLPNDVIEAVQLSFAGEPVAEKKASPLFIIIPTFVFIALLVVVGVFIYEKKYKPKTKPKKEGGEEKEAQEQKEVEEVSEDDITAIEHYAEGALAQGSTKDEVRRQLLAVGWDEEKVDMVLHKVHVPHNDLDKIRHFAEAKLAQGKSQAEIRKTLLDVGWEENKVNMVLHDVHMPHDDLDRLAEFLRQGLKDGKSEEELTKALLSVGWDKDKIMFILEKVKKKD